MEDSDNAVFPDSCLHKCESGKSDNHCCNSNIDISLLGNFVCAYKESVLDSNKDSHWYPLTSSLISLLKILKVLVFTHDSHQKNASCYCGYYIREYLPGIISTMDRVDKLLFVPYIWVTEFHQDDSCFLDNMIMFYKTRQKDKVKWELDNIPVKQNSS